MSFVMGAFPYSSWEQVIPLLEKYGWLSGQVQDVECWLDSDNGETPVLIIHRRPEYLVAAAIADGLAPSEACNKWEQQAKKLLEWLKRNRRRACLVEIDALLSADANLCELGERLGVTKPAPEPISIELPDIHPLHLLLALQLVRQSEQCALLLAELDASTLPLTTQSFCEPTIALDGLVKQLQSERSDTQKQVDNARVLIEQQKQQNHEISAQLQASTEESALLLEQLHLVQEELETVLISGKQQAEALQQDVQLKQSRVSSVEADLRELKKEHEILLARHTQTSKTLIEQSDNLQQQLDAAQAELKQLHGERAAAKKAEEVNQRDKQLMQQENHLLLEQLHLVQEALEQKFHSQQQFEAELKNSDAALVVANAEIAKLQNELNKIKASRFYKLINLAQPKNQTAINKRKLQRNVRKLKASPLFDAEWYLMSNADVVQENMDPASHYIKFGAVEGRDPSTYFNTNWYLQANPDVAESGINPLIHYIEHGKAEGRAPRPEEQNYLPSPGGQV